MDNAQIRSIPLRGLSFSLADLTLIQSWSEAYGLRMTVQPDHGSETEEIEEVLTFHNGHGQPSRCIMWRDNDVVYVKSLIGRTRCYLSAAEALTGLTPRCRVAVTDVVATRWPEPNATAG